MTAGLVHRRAAAGPSARRAHAGPLVVVGAPFSGATTLAWALGRHPQLAPVVGAEPAGRLVEALSHLAELVSLPEGAGPIATAGALPRGLVVSGPDVAADVGLALRLCPELRLVHVLRPVEEVVPRLVEAARRDGSRLGAGRAEAIWRRVVRDCLEAEEAAGVGRALRVDYELLVRDPAAALGRSLELLGLESSEACFAPLRLLSTAPPARERVRAALPATRPPRDRGRPPAEAEAARRLRQLVEAVVPAGATILVASRGDEELLRFRGRVGAHFPQLPGGAWAGFYPADGAAALEHLLRLVAHGCSHLLFPRAAFWWLDHYRELRDHLERSGRLLACDSELAVVWELRPAGPLKLPTTLASTPRTPREPNNAQAFAVERDDAPPRRPGRVDGALWALTTFYNPAGYGSKKANYERFRAGLDDAGVPLLTVELAFGDAPFELADGDADLLVQVRGGDVLWQKERLLNIGVRRLPDDCQAVAWLDADVLFARADWARETVRLLRRHVVVQPFSHCVRLPRGVYDCEPATLPFGPGEGHLFHGIAWGVRTKGPSSLSSYDRHGHTGFAWAARRELLEAHGLYEANLLGNGDTDIAHAMFESEDYWALQKLGERARAHLARWARPFASAVGGSVAHLDGVVTHLWHGAVEHRLYDRPLDILHTFDPDRDLVCDGPDATLRLSVAAPPELRAWAAAYFAARREDG